MSSRSDKSQADTHPSPGPVPLPPPDRRSSFSQNPSFSTLFSNNRGSPPRAAPDPSLSRRFSWSYAPPKESSSAIDDSDDIVASPVEERRGSEIGRRLSTTASSIREALGFKADEPTSPRGLKTSPFAQRKASEPGSIPSAGGFSASSEGSPSNIGRNAETIGGDFSTPRTMGTTFMQRRRASFGKSRSEADPHADRMLQGHFSVD